MLNKIFCIVFFQRPSEIISIPEVSLSIIIHFIQGIIITVIHFCEYLGEKQAHRVASSVF